MSDIDFRALAAFFPAEAIEWRIQQSGEKNGRTWARCVPYVDNRAIMDRLDQVAGPENWRNEFRAGPCGGVLCGLSIRVGDDWVTKWDGAENTKGVDGGEVKGGLSSSMKRAAVQWGIGRYLYAVGETYAVIGERGRLRGRTKDQKAFRWDPPELPAQVLPRVRSADSHEAMLDFLRAVQEKISRNASVHVQGNTRPLLPFVRTRWPSIEQDAGVARVVVKAAEQDTGTSFHAFVETGAV
jgi:hypothetical protein